MKKINKVEIEWNDSYSLRDRTWHRTEDILELEEDGIYLTIGYLIKKEKTRIIVAGSLSPEFQNVGDIFIIPMGCIKKIKYL